MRCDLSIPPGPELTGCSHDVITMVKLYFTFLSRSIKKERALICFGGKKRGGLHSILPDPEHAMQTK